jgi:hypothetical protein
MNLFRSEEHVRNWLSYVPGTEDGILPLEDIALLFSGDLFRKRLDPDYVSCSQDYLGIWLSALSEIAKKRPFWKI